MLINLDLSSDIEVICNYLQLAGMKVADIGCGDGVFAISLAEKGASVIGVEPDPEQAEKNREIELIANVKLLEASAQALPFNDQSQNILFFRFSFHHIPQALHAQVFKEAARVLKTDGQLFIIEPVAEGSAQYVMELFHDETKVRAQVQTALTTLAPRYFVHQQTYPYHTVRTFADFPAYLDRYANLSYNRYQRNDVDNLEIRNRFKEHANAQGSVELIQPIKADLFIKSRTIYSD